MVRLLMAAVLLAGASSESRRAEVNGPKVLVGGPLGHGGAVRAVGYSCSGFGGGPIVDVHALGGSVRVKDLAVNVAGEGNGTFAFTVEYDAQSPSPVDLIIYVSGGTGKSGDGFKQYSVALRRSN